MCFFPASPTGPSSVELCWQKKEPELVWELERYQLDIDGVTTMHITDYTFPELPTVNTTRWVWGYSQTPWCSARVIFMDGISRLSQGEEGVWFRDYRPAFFR